MIAAKMSQSTSPKKPSTRKPSTTRKSEATHFDHVITILGLGPNIHLLRALETEGISEIERLLHLDNISLTSLQYHSVNV